MSLMMLSFVVYFLSVVIVANCLYWFSLRGNWEQVTMGSLIACTAFTFIPILNTMLTIALVFYLVVDLIKGPYVSGALAWKPFAKD